MKYTKNIGIKLLLMGFEYRGGHKHEGIEYDIYKKGIIEVEVDHYNKRVKTEIIMNDKPLKIKSLDQLKKLDKLINQ